MWNRICERFKRDITTRDDFMQVAAQLKALKDAKHFQKSLRQQVLDCQVPQGQQMHFETT